MRRPKVYLETSIFNFVFADDAPDKKQDTLKLFEEIQQGKYVPYTSAYVLQELRRAAEPKQSQMVELIYKYNMEFLGQNDEAERLANIYIQDGVIPQKYFMDGVHIALSSISDLDFIVSFNFRHIVKRKTMIMTESINIREGYRRIGIHSPTEVIENDE
jgi:predicted nucleic acid-binding protein